MLSQKEEHLLKKGSPKEKSYAFENLYDFQFKHVLVKTLLSFLTVLSNAFNTTRGCGLHGAVRVQSYPDYPAQGRFFKHSLYISVRYLH